MAPVTATRVMSEQELRAWTREPAPIPNGQQHVELYELVERIQDLELRRELVRLQDLEIEDMSLREDQLLLTVGSLCMLNGQRALWSSIWHTLYENSQEDPFGWLERATRRARRRKL